MSSSINLTASARANLSSLQDTAKLMATTQAHLSTGKKVSSALDNPVNFFTAAGLNSRSTQLSGLLDGMSNGIQTIQAANKGITSMTSLIEQLQSTVKQARQDTTGTVTPGTRVTTSATNTSTTGGKIAFTIGSQTIDVNTFSGTVTPATPATITGTAPPTAGAYPAPDATITLEATGFNGGTAQTITLSGDSDSVDELVMEINTELGAASTIQASNENGALRFTNSAGNNVTVGGTAAAALNFGGSNTVSTDGVPASGTGTALTTDQLVAAINGNTSLQGKVTASSVGGRLSLVNSSTSDITVTGFSATALSGGAGAGTTLTAGTAQLSSARQSLANQFNSLKTQIDKVSQDASFNGTNLLQGDHLKMVFNEKSGQANNNIDLSLKNADNSDFGILNTNSLGITAAATAQGGAGVDFSSNAALDTLSDALTTATNTLQTQASALGANLSIAQTRQDFTKQIIDVLNTGSANLTDADMNEEAANSQALSTRQSIGISALSLANQAQQGILQLLR